jgi:hypothetical protein
LPKKDQTSANYVTRKIHGLSFKDYRRDMNQKYLFFIIRKLAKICNSKKLAMGYKGGHLERDILIRAGCEQIVDIGDPAIGAPKFDVLANDPGIIRYARRHIQFVNITNPSIRHLPCNRHRRSRSYTYHCPQKEVAYFASWLLRK